MGLFHSRRSPSSAHRWRLCPGSVNAEQGLSDSVGEEARQGTCFHEIAADCLEYGIDPWHAVGKDVTWEETVDGEVVTITRTFTREMADKMMPGLIQLRAMEDAPGAKMFVERRVSLEKYVGPGESGTADCFIIDLYNWRIINWDWKWGAGVPVSPEWNDQTILYTLGVWEDYAAEMFWEAHMEGLGPDGDDPNPLVIPDIEVVICIEQPRAPGGGGTWTTTMQDLLAEGRAIKKDAEATEDPDAPRIPGEKQCKFCKAARHNTCKERAGMVLSLLDLDDEELDDDFMLGLPVDLPRSLTPTQRSNVLLNRKLIERFLEQLHEEAMEDARLGKETPGLKRVAGRRPPRKWKDEKRAEMLLKQDFGDEAFNRKLRSPAQIEGGVKKQRFKTRYQAMVIEGDPAPALVNETDPRPPMKAAIDLLDDEADSADSADSANSANSANDLI